MSRGGNDIIGLYKVELQVVNGGGKLVRTGGASHHAVRDAVVVAFNYFKADSNRVSGLINPNTSDYLLSLTHMQGAGSPDQVSLALLTALCRAALGRQRAEPAGPFGRHYPGGTVTPVDKLASSLQVALDCGAKRILILPANAVDIASVPGDLFAKFQTSFYSDPVDVVFKALGVA